MIRFRVVHFLCVYQDTDMSHYCKVRFDYVAKMMSARLLHYGYFFPVLLPDEEIAWYPLLLASLSCLPEAITTGMLLILSFFLCLLLEITQ